MGHHRSPISSPTPQFQNPPPVINGLGVRAKGWGWWAACGKGQIVGHFIKQMPINDCIYSNCNAIGNQSSPLFSPTPQCHGSPPFSYILPHTAIPKPTVGYKWVTNDGADAADTARNNDIDAVLS
uniref:Uncharacterized protein n=1 Tax=Nelumbo nucifera TaxID=4432 RepID=A0A822YN68_NELNU|nr:TPA_asm: hypothetical protein HUJ06_004622 [Nelumbo nucifera]